MSFHNNLEVQLCLSSDRNIPWSIVAKNMACTDPSSFSCLSQSSHTQRHSISRANIRSGFGTTTKLVLLIKIYLNEICGGVQTGNNWYDTFPLTNGLKKKKKRCFTATALQLGFAIYHLE